MPIICKIWNPHFQTQIYLIKVPLNVNIVKQDLLYKKQFLKILWSEVWKGGFQLIHILGLLGMNFDAVVVEVKTFLVLFRLALAILCFVHNMFSTCSELGIFLYWTRDSINNLSSYCGLKYGFYRSNFLQNPYFSWCKNKCF